MTRSRKIIEEENLEEKKGIDFSKLSQTRFFIQSKVKFDIR